MTCTVELHEELKASPSLLAQHCDKDDRQQDMFDGTWADMYHCKSCRSTLMVVR